MRCLVCWFSLRHWDEEELHVEVLEILCSSCHSEGFVAAGYVECIEWDWTVVRCSRRHWMTHFDSLSWDWSCLKSGHSEHQMHEHGHCRTFGFCHG